MEFDSAESNVSIGVDVGGQRLFRLGVRLVQRALSITDAMIFVHFTDKGSQAAHQRLVMFEEERVDLRANDENRGEIVEEQKKNDGETDLT
jgi:hypothetical protein